MKNEEIEKFLKENAIIIFDSSVWLDIYRLLPDDIYNTLTLLNKSKLNDIIYVPSHVAEEYHKNYRKVKAEHYALIKEVKTGLLKVINSFEEKILKNMESSKERYKLTDTTSQKKIEKKLKEIKNIANDYIKYNETQSMLSNERVAEKIEELVKNICKLRLIDCLTEDEINEILKEGVKRYSAKTPPGYMDADKDDNKYGDLIIWKEIIKFAKKNCLNIIFVTNDNKEDWFDIAGFRKELIEEFDCETGQKILGIHGQDFYEFAKYYYLSKNETLKDLDSYISQNYEKYLDYIDSDLNNYVNDKLFYCDGGHCDIYSPCDILSDYDGSYYEFGDLSNLQIVSCKSIYRDGGDVEIEVEYYIEFTVNTAGYEGRDDETRDIILSPIRTHSLAGNIKFNITAPTSEFLFPTGKFDVTVIDNDIVETDYDDGFRDDDYE